ncbi:MAG TPA: alpha/beta hydrolase fold domain-containing protein [Acidimicrobiia bacterium]|nr:alpha/beta hydrolase fold domain-containing protein [Acidimicrobiia bacterium]
MRRLTALLCVVLAVALGVAACAPPAPNPPAPYLDQVYGATVTSKAQPVTWGAAPVIDPHYGGTLYAGTSLAQPDPRPALLPGNLEPLRLWVADPQDDTTNRPAIVWVHGGGFAFGIDGMYGLANASGKDYAERGYVGFSVEYRTDTTVVGGSATSQPASLCQWVQDNWNPNDPVWQQRYQECQRNLAAAQYDVLAAVRWIRVHAMQYRVDPSKIAVGGFSAGAVTAGNVAYRGDDVGTVHYFSGDDLSVASSKVQAAFGASGCEYDPASIGAGDAPTSWIHSRFDQAVPYSCIAQTVTTARADGLVAELTSYCTESAHAENLYAEHKAATDTQWTTFLARELHIYSGMRPPSADPVCPS